MRSVLVVALVMLNLADVVTTDMVLARGGLELNPLSAWLIHNDALFVTKLGIASFVGVAAVLAAHTRKVSTLLAPAVAYYLVVVANNLLQMQGVI